MTQGTNNVPIVATNLNGYATTNTFQVVIPPASGSYLYDLNGNLLNDGTRTYSWDAKDELVGIVYTTGPNAGNHTEFTYNGAGGRVKIVERTGTVLGSGTITSTKQYVAGEERDGNNHITKRYFDEGEQRINGSTATNYFYTFDHLGSVREMMDNNGTTIDARYSYDPYGRSTQVSGSISCDFGFAGMYLHATSGLNLTQYRAYNPNTGRWISRDPSGEDSGLNLYAYCDDNPICNTDPEGLSDDGGQSFVFIRPTSVPPPPPTYSTIDSFGPNQCMDDISDGGGGDGGGGWINGVQITLTAAGFIPGAGEVANAASAVVSLTQGDWVGAGLSVVALIPFAGAVADAAKAARLAKGYKSFTAFKRAQGAAGAGMAWHHIVEQTASNVQRFGARAIHNTDNLIKLPHGAGAIHNRISGFYSSIQPFTGGVTVRQWLSTQSFEEQAAFGRSVIQQFGGKP